MPGMDEPHFPRDFSSLERLIRDSSQAVSGQCSRERQAKAGWPFKA